MVYWSLVGVVVKVFLCSCNYTLSFFAGIVLGCTGILFMLVFLVKRRGRKSGRSK